MLTERLEFAPERDAELFEAIPADAAVFLLRGNDARAEPYVSKTADLRRRLQRLLGAGDERSRRLNLRDRVRWIEYSRTGSDFESGFLLYRTLRESFPKTYAARMRLRFAPLIRLHMENAFPRASLTTRLGRWDGLSLYYGPFASKAAAEKYMNDSLDFFKMRRCVDDLHPDPKFPGCIYSEMKMCLAPCFKGCTDQEYSAEVERVRSYFDSSGESMLRELAAQREAASADLKFEEAAAIHVKLEKLKPITGQAPEIVRRIDQLSGLIVQRSYLPDSVTFFYVERAAISGPLPFCIQSPEQTKSQSMESRVQASLESFKKEGRSPLETMEHLALLKRWYFRGTRMGEIFLADHNGQLPMRRIVRGIGRVLRGERPEQDLLDQPKVRDGIMEFPIARESEPEDSGEERKPQ